MKWMTIPIQSSSSTTSGASKGNLWETSTKSPSRPTKHSVKVLKLNPSIWQATDSKSHQDQTLANQRSYRTSTTIMQGWARTRKSSCWSHREGIPCRPRTSGVQGGPPHMKKTYSFLTTLFHQATTLPQESTSRWTWQNEWHPMSVAHTPPNSCRQHKPRKQQK